MRKEYKRMMDQLSPREELVRDLISQVNKEHGTRRFWMHKKKFFLALAAALVVLTGSAVAVANSLGVLDLFFQGDTSQLQPYVQTGVDCAETEDYRLTLDSSLYDGQMIYAVITVTGLNDPAIAALKNNQVIAESHRDFWGQETVDALMESGSTGPDTFWAYIPEDGEQNTQTMPRISSLGSKELPSPSDSSRSWQVDITLNHFVGELEYPLELCLNFMGREHSVSIPLTHIAEPIHLTPNLEVTTNPYTGRRGILKEFILTPVSYSVRTESLDGQSDSAGLSVGELLPRDLFFLRMKDGSVLTRTQLGESNRQFELAVDLNQVQSIIYGYTEFPVDGSQPFPADLDAHLYPFFCTIFPTQDGVWRVSLEELCRGLGAEYRREEEVQTATAVYRGTTVQVTAGSVHALVDGESVDLTYTALDENGTEFVNTLPVTLENGNLIVAASVLLDAWDISMGTIWDEGHYTLEGLVVTP